MSSWDTNPWSNFCDPYWELMCHNKYTRDLRNIHTTGNSCVDALSCVNVTLKLLWYFDLLMEKSLGCYFQVRSPYYQVTQCNQKTHILVSSRWQFKSENVKKKKREASTLTTATTRVHLPKSVSTDLTI